MSSSSRNIDKSLELIQKTYNLQSTNNSQHDNVAQVHTPTGKVSTHQPSRKTSVHDIHEVNKLDLDKIFGEIQENLSHLKALLETTNSVSMIRDEFFKLKAQLFNKITDFIYKLANETGKRGSISSKGNSSSWLSTHPQNLVYSIEYFRTELIKAEYLFRSLPAASAIGSGTLTNIIVRPISLTHAGRGSVSSEEARHLQDLMQIKEDIATLEEHAYVLNQRYYSQIPDMHESDDRFDKVTAQDAALNAASKATNQRLRFAPMSEKYSARSSIASNENSTHLANFYQKCQMICCMCRPNYL